MPAAGTTNSRGRAKPNPRDFTGVQKAKAEAGVAEEREQRAAEIALAAEVETLRRDTEVVDYTQGGHQGPTQAQPSPTPQISQEMLDEIEEQALEVGPKEVTIRVNSPIEDMVYGRQVISEAHVSEDGQFVPAVHGNLQFYSFAEGQRYKVPVDLALHLEEKGYLYH